MVKDLNMAIRSGDNSGPFPASARLFHQEFPVQKSQATVLCLRHLDLICLANFQLIKPLQHGLNVQWKDLLKQKTFHPGTMKSTFAQLAGMHVLWLAPLALRPRVSPGLPNF